MSLHPACCRRCHGPEQRAGDVPAVQRPAGGAAAGGQLPPGHLRSRPAALPHQQPGGHLWPLNAAPLHFVPAGPACSTRFANVLQFIYLPSPKTLAPYLALTSPTALTCNTFARHAGPFACLRTRRLTFLPNCTCVQRHAIQAKLSLSCSASSAPRLCLLICLASKLQSLSRAS